MVSGIESENSPTPITVAAWIWEGGGRYTKTINFSSLVQTAYTGSILSLQLQSIYQYGETGYRPSSNTYTGITGNPYGQLCLRLAVHPGSYYARAAKKGAEDSASARKQFWNVLSCASVVETVMRTYLSCYFKDWFHFWWYYWFHVSKTAIVGSKLSWSPIRYIIKLARTLDQNEIKKNLIQASNYFLDWGLYFDTQLDHFWWKLVNMIYIYIVN